MDERAALLHLTGWCGNVALPVVVIGETPKRYRVRLTTEARLPSRRIGRPGDVILVPKRPGAVSFPTERKA